MVILALYVEYAEFELIQRMSWFTDVYNQFYEVGLILLAKGFMSVVR